jgi:protocatechuate 3,4-dioxygenase beta subunit
MRIFFIFSIVALGVALAVPAGAQGRGAQGGQRGGRGAAARDNGRTVPAGTGVIAGRVLAAETARPIKRARVVVSGGGQPRATSTDEQGKYKITGLPAGSYRVTATKTGFVDGAFGQRRALPAGTPIELADNQQVADADVKLARGGVITGHVFDEDGEPLSRAIVTVLRSQYVRGEKQLAPAGTADQTDDRGQFRIFGLPPGDYVVSATAGGMERLISQVAQLVVPGATSEQTTDNSGYAPTFFPGVVAASEAGRVRLAASQEIGGIDFSIQVVPFATVRGVVAGGTGTVLLVSDTSVAAGGGRGGGGRGGLEAIRGALLGGPSLRTETQADGSFTIRNVTPGKYTIVARVDAGSGDPKMAIQSLTVAGEEMTVMLTPVSGVDVSGTITLEASASNVPKSLSGFRVNLVPTDAAAATAGRGGRPTDTGENGHFTLRGVFPGRFAIRAVAPGGWMMKTVYLDGRDVTDQPVEIRGEGVSGLNVIFTDRIASLSGLVRDRAGTPVEGATIIAFPQDDALWQPQSRHIVTARTSRTGAYRIAALPAGDYFVVAVDDVEQGEWFDPAFLEQVRGGAVRLTVADGEQRTQDLKPPASS